MREIKCSQQLFEFTNIFCLCVINVNLQCVCVFRSIRSLCGGAAPPEVQTKGHVSRVQGEAGRGAPGAWAFLLLWRNQRG